MTDEHRQRKFSGTLNSWSKKLDGDFKAYSKDYRNWKVEFENRLNERIGWKISTKLRYYVKNILKSLPEFMWESLPNDDEGWKAYILAQDKAQIKANIRHQILRMQRIAEMPLRVTKNLAEAKEEIRHELVKTRIEKIKHQAFLDAIREFEDDGSWEGDRNQDRGDLV